MMNFEREAIEYYYAGEDRTYMCNYLLVVNHAGVDNIYLKSALYRQGVWKPNYTLRYMGEGFKSWRDVLKYTKKRSKHLCSQMRSMLHPDKRALWVNFCKINEIPPTDKERINDDIDQLIAQVTDNKYRFRISDLDSSDDEFCFSIEDINNPQPMTLERLMPIWVAHQSFSSRLLFDYNNGLLKTIN